MRRLRRYILNALTGLSLLLCVAAAGLWSRSLRTQDTILADNLDEPDAGGGPRTQWRLSSDAGDAVLLRVEGPIAFGHPPGRNRWSEPVDPRPRWWPAGDRAWGLLGASLHRGDYNAGPPAPGRTRIPYWSVVVPLWMPAALAAALPLIRVTQWVRSRGRPEHACPACGYDLRATPDRCPECGAVLKGNTA